jgi:peptide deformylase
MAIQGAMRPITELGDEILRRPCREVAATEYGTPELAALIADMFVVMQVAEGAGLAANQVGVDLRVFVYDCHDGLGGRHVGHVVNPVLEQPGPRGRRLLDDVEGCLSVPGATALVSRTEHAVVRGFDQDGEPLVVEGDAYFARCLQHETDHLQGTLYLDRLANRERKDALRQMRERREAVHARRAERAARLPIAQPIGRDPI